LRGHLEEQRVVVAADGTIEGSELVRSEIAGVMALDGRGLSRESVRMDVCEASRMPTDYAGSNAAKQSVKLRGRAFVLLEEVAPVLERVVLCFDHVV